MTYCFTKGLRECYCLKLRVRWCPQCERWICRMLFDIHPCYKGTQLYGREQRMRRSQKEASSER